MVLVPVPRLVVVSVLVLVLRLVLPLLRLLLLLAARCDVLGCGRARLLVLLRHGGSAARGWACADASLASRVGDVGW